MPLNIQVIRTTVNSLQDLNKVLAGVDPDDNGPMDWGFHKRVLIDFKAHTIAIPAGTVQVGSSCIMGLPDLIKTVVTSLANTWHKLDFAGHRTADIMFSTCWGGVGTQFLNPWHDNAAGGHDGVIQSVSLTRTVLNHSATHQFRKSVLLVCPQLPRIPLPA